MSIEGSGQCGICGAWSDYCLLETPTGIDIDCRRLMLRDESHRELYAELAEINNGMNRDDEHGSDVES